MIFPTSNVSTSKGLVDLIFNGPELDKRSITITDLGQSLLAMQVIINKTYLFQEDKLFSNARLSNAERQKIALQVQAQRQGSDIYQLIPLLHDPLVTAVIGPIIFEGLKALMAYMKQTVFNSPAPTNQKLIIAIYPEVESLTQRINKTSGISQINLTLKESESTRINATIDSSVKAYVRDCNHQKLYGDVSVIRGLAVKLDQKNYSIDLQEGSGRVTRVYLTKKLLEVVRYHSRADALLEVTGRTIYRLGDSTKEEFQAEKLFVIKR